LSVLTKVFVVLVTVLSVLLVALIVPFVANTQNYRQLYESAQSQARGAEVKAASVQAEINAAQEANALRVAELNNKNQQLTATINTLQTDLADARANGAKSASDLAKLQADVSRLSAAANTSASLLDATRSELSQWREKAVAADTQLIQRADRINQLESTNETLVRSVDRLREQMTALQEQSKELEKLWASVPESVRQQVTGQTASADGGEVASTVAIRGQVTKVETMDDTTFVQLNVGSNDGVRPNMKFLVHKGDQFVGTVMVSAVDANASAGRVTLAQGTITAGDAVLTGGF
jgi:myosin heavy subunit